MTSSTEEAELLIAIIDNWVEGLPTAGEATIQDRTIESPEELLDLMAEYDNQALLLQTIRGKVVKERERHDYGH